MGRAAEESRCRHAGTQGFARTPKPRVRGKVATVRRRGGCQVYREGARNGGQGQGKSNCRRLDCVAQGYGIYGVGPSYAVERQGIVKPARPPGAATYPRCSPLSASAEGRAREGRSQARSTRSEAGIVSRQTIRR